MTLVNNFEDTAKATPPSLWPTDDSGFTLLVIAAGHDEDDVQEFLEQQGVLSAEEDAHDGWDEIEYDCPLAGICTGILDEYHPSLRQQFKDYLDARFDSARANVDDIAACVAALEVSSFPKIVAQADFYDPLKGWICSLNDEDMERAIVTTFGNLDVAENDVMALLIPSRQMVQRYADYGMRVNVISVYVDQIDGQLDEGHAKDLVAAVFRTLAQDFSWYRDDLRKGMEFMIEAQSDLTLVQPNPQVLETHGQMRLIP